MSTELKLSRLYRNSHGVAECGSHVVCQVMTKGFSRLRNISIPRRDDGRLGQACRPPYINAVNIRTFAS